MTSLTIQTEKKITLHWILHITTPKDTSSRLQNYIKLSIAQNIPSLCKMIIVKPF